MAGSGYREWLAGEQLTDAHMQQYSGATVQKVSANTYRLIGKVTP